MTETVKVKVVDAVGLTPPRARCKETFVHKKPLLMDPQISCLVLSAISPLDDDYGCRDEPKQETLTGSKHHRQQTPDMRYPLLIEEKPIWSMPPPKKEFRKQPHWMISTFAYGDSQQA